MNEYNESSDRKVSKYNAAVAQLYRLDNLWQLANSYSCSGQLTKWNWILDTVWREFAINDKEDVKEFKEINKKLIRSILTKALFYQLLMEKERFLRMLQDDLGKGTAYRESDEAYIDN